MLKKILFLLSLCILSACNHQKISLKTKTQDLHESMKAYYQLDTQSFESENFEAKVIDVYKVPYSTKVFYRYQIVLAPKFDFPVALKSIKLYPQNQKITDYLNSETSVGNKELESWNVTPDLSVFQWKQNEKPYALKFFITFSNLSNYEMDKHQITQNDFDSQLCNLKLMIRYNQSEETILINNLELKPFTNNTRPDLTNLSLNGQTESTIEIYK